MKGLLYPAILATCILIVVSCSSTGNKPEAQNDNPAAPDSTSAAVVEQTPPVSTFVEGDTTFGAFIKLFDNDGTDVPESVRSFLNVEEVGRVTTKGMLETSPFYVILYTHFMPVGPGMDVLHVASLDRGDGGGISDIRLGSSYPSSGPDGGGEDVDYDYDSERHVLTVTNSITDWNEKDQEEFTTEVISFYMLEPDGTLISGRKYPQISRVKLNASDLTSYSKDELKIMRNEIFAVHGFIFESELMKGHYGAMRWYKPVNKNVDNMLNEFEKANVTIIKSVEDQK